MCVGQAEPCECGYGLLFEKLKQDPKPTGNYTHIRV